MKTNSRIATSETKTTDSIPILTLSRIGLISRNYNKTFQNGRRDFSQVLPDVLKRLDEKGCDAALFSLFSIIPQKPFVPHNTFSNLKHIKAIFLEEFQDREPRKQGRYMIYYLSSSSNWEKYQLCQKFGRFIEISQKKMDDFVKNEIPKRIIGNSCVLLCGEINGVKYSQTYKKVQDTFGLRTAIKDTNIILNPSHDRMTRFEMKLKRQFLSAQFLSEEPGRWVVSIWNKGRKDKNGRVRDGKKPAWIVFHNGEEMKVETIRNNLGVEIGILDCT